MNHEHEEVAFLLGEYSALWDEHGIDEIQRIQNGLRARIRMTPRRPAPVRPAAATAPAAPSTLQEVRAWLGDCRRCGLCEQRNHIVFGTGNPTTRLMFVGEGPGADEDRQGEPFVGRAGELLNRIIEAMGFKREDVYIANVVKCRPPDNRTPQPDEVAQCLPFLQAQVRTVRPECIVALGGTATSALTGSSGSMGNLRGRFQPVTWEPGIPVLPTYHPAYLLRNPPAKKLVWEDMKLVISRLEAHK